MSEKGTKAHEWFSASQMGADHLSAYDRIVNALTPKGKSPTQELKRNSIDKLVDIITENFSEDEIREWVEKELNSARQALQNYSHGEINETYKSVTWKSGFCTYPVEYKRLFQMVLSEEELEEAEKLFLFYQDEDD